MEQRHKHFQAVTDVAIEVIAKNQGMFPFTVQFIHFKQTSLQPV